MTSIAHISDLHFGVEIPGLADALLQELEARRPALTVVSGDLTQRARQKEFLAAQSFLSRLSSNKLVVPGNHDVPLYDVARRFLAPLNRYKALITADLDPWFQEGEIAVLGLNTARSFTWKSGRISLEQIELIRTRFERVPTDVFKILVTHHPFIPPPGEDAAGIDLVGRAAVALPVIDHACVDLLLAGHLHHGYTGDVRAYYPATKRSIVVAQAGTAISHRTRDEPNAYNWIELNADTIAIYVRVWTGARFEEQLTTVYRLHQDEWQLVSPV
jgi:3',5'-cyclic AMP phosphodiesterase CpdA